MSDLVAVALRELETGIAVWSRRKWPSDFHNSLYTSLASMDLDRGFTNQWWKEIYPTLRAWRATRPFPRALLTQRFIDRATDIGAAWQAACLPYRDADIAAITWNQVKAFPEAVATIKPTKSPVFTSKLCHFLLPSVFPVVDNAALGRWARMPYADYFTSVQQEWASIDDMVRQALIADLGRRIKASSPQTFTQFPFAIKILELRRIGRQQAR